MNSIKHIIAIASGKGGVGKSTTAVNLALALQARGGRIGLLDADIYGPSVQAMLGVADDLRPEQKDGKFLLPVMAHGLSTMSMAYLSSARTPMVWRGPMAGSALAQMLEHTLWGKLDVLVIDMPPGTGDIQLTLSQKASLAGAVIVTTPQDIALLDARKGIEMFRKVDVPILGIIENMAMHQCSQCGHREAIFGTEGGDQVAQEYGVPLLARLPLALTIREQIDAGNPTVVAVPDSPEALCYLQAAQAIEQALAHQGASGAARSAPSISISDD